MRHMSDEREMSDMHSKNNALQFYDDVQKNLTEKGKNVDQLRVRVLAFRDFTKNPHYTYFKRADITVAFDYTKVPL